MIIMYLRTYQYHITSNIQTQMNPVVVFLY